MADSELNPEVPSEEGQPNPASESNAQIEPQPSLLPHGDLNGIADPSQLVPNLNGLPPSDFSDPSIADPSLLSTFDPSMGMTMPTMPSMMNGFNGAPAEAISADEIALYDRQIRLWGVQAQEKLRSASILVIGIKALGNEIAKNLVLAGIGSLTVLDHEVVTEEDLGSEFLLTEEHVGQNRAQAASTNLQKLNPRVRLIIDTDYAVAKTPDYFSLFDITIATNLDLDTLSNINAMCRIFSRKFYAADIHGMYGYVFADLISHDYVLERTKSNIPTPAPGTMETPTRAIISTTTKKESGKTIEVVTKREIYSPLVLANTSPLPTDLTRSRRKKLQVTPLLSCLRALFEFQRSAGGRLPATGNPQDLRTFTTLAQQQNKDLNLPQDALKSEFLRSFLQNLGSEISPTAAFLGGSLAQDIINVLGQREQPLQNFLLFDGDECKAPIYSMHPIFEDTVNTTGMGNGDGTATMMATEGAGSVTGTEAGADAGGGDSMAGPSGAVPPPAPVTAQV
ncbi:MAG: hypothetical protein Q9227_002923 [Pyrenula ochraceoflavens]